MTIDFAIQFHSVSKTYLTGGGENVAALSTIDLEVRRGEFIALVGPSGSGKSTLLSLAGCLEGQSDGEIRIFGNTLLPDDGSRRAWLRRNFIGFIFQNYKLLKSSTVLENVVRPLIFRGTAPNTRRKYALQQLKRVDLLGLEDRLPHQLSGGQQQRVAIARALAIGPKLLIADEPTGALDSRNSEGVIGLIRHLSENEGITVVMATHDPSMRKFADRIIELKDGRIAVSRQSSAHANL